MIGLLAKWFIPNSGALDAPGVRGAYGTLCGAVGIALNALLFLGKLLAGSLSGSIAVTADAFNNLSDAGSSLITLIGFRMAGRKPDPQHPFGHGRIEYISGFIVALAILLMGFELLTSSIEKIAAPEPVAFSPHPRGVDPYQALHGLLQPPHRREDRFLRHARRGDGQPERLRRHGRGARLHAHRALDAAAD